MQTFENALACQGFHLHLNRNFMKEQLIMTAVNLSSYVLPESGILRIIYSLGKLLEGAWQNPIERGVYLGQIARGVCQLKGYYGILKTVDIVMTILLSISRSLERYSTSP